MSVTSLDVRIITFSISVSVITSEVIAQSLTRIELVRKQSQCFVSCPQRAVFARDPCRKWEWEQSAALGESSLPTALPRADVGVLWGACVRGYAAFTLGSHAASWGLSDQPGSWQWGEVSLWFSSAVTLSIESAGCNFSLLRAEISASLCCCSLGATSDAGSSLNDSSCSLNEDYWSCLLLLCHLMGLFVPAWELLCWSSAVCLCDVCRQIRQTQDVHIKPAHCRATAVQPCGLRNRTAIRPKSLCVMQVSLANFTSTISILTSFQTHSDTTSNSRRGELVCRCLSLELLCHSE